MGRSQPNIWQMQAQRNVSGIIQALDDTDPTVRRRAVIALRSLGAAEAVPKLTELREREYNTAFRAQIDTAIRVLSQGRQSEAVRRTQLLSQLNSLDEDKIIQAINELADLGDLTVIEYLVVIFRNPLQPPQIRLAAAEALLKMDSAPASVALLGALRRPDWQVRRNAAAVLGQLDADWSVEPLIDVVRNDPHPTVRKTAAAALRRIGTPEARRALLTMRPVSPTTPQIPKTAPPVKKFETSEAPAVIINQDEEDTQEMTPPSNLPLDQLPQPRWLRRKPKG